MIRRPPRSTLFPTRRSSDLLLPLAAPLLLSTDAWTYWEYGAIANEGGNPYRDTPADHQDRKSTRLNSSHGYISYAVFCLKKKKKQKNNQKYQKNKQQTNT